MVVLQLCRKLGVSQCPGWHNKAKSKSMARRTDHKSDEALTAYAVEVNKNDESRETVGLAYDV